MTQAGTMRTIAIAVAIVVLGGCAQLKKMSNQPGAMTGASASAEQRPEWLRDPARGEYPYNPKGW